MLDWIKEYAAVLTLFVTIVGGGFGGGIALYQWGKQISIRRTEFAYQIIKQLRNNKEIAATHYLIEYGEFHYTEAFHNNHDLEQKIDELLSVLNYACYLLKSRAIGKRDFSIFRYEVVWILRNRDLQAYLWNLHHWSKSNQSPCSFQFLVDYGLREKLFPTDFISTECKSFISRQYLNF